MYYLVNLRTYLILFLILFDTSFIKFKLETSSTKLLHCKNMNGSLISKHSEFVRNKGLYSMHSSAEAENIL